jgi:hypothetical protein
MSKHLAKAGVRFEVERYIAKLIGADGKYLDRKHFSDPKVARRLRAFYKNTEYEGLFTKHKINRAREAVRDYYAAHPAHTVAASPPAPEPTAPEVAAPEPAPEVAATPPATKPPKPTPDPEPWLVTAYLDRLDPAWRSKAAGYLSLPHDPAH